MDFKSVLQFASKNQKSKEIQTKPSQKNARPKRVSDDAVKAYLDKKKREEQQKDIDEKKKKIDLIRMRVENNTMKTARAMASRTKDNLKIFDLTEDDGDRIKPDKKFIFEGGEHMPKTAPPKPSKPTTLEDMKASCRGKSSSSKPKHDRGDHDSSKSRHDKGDHRDRHQKHDRPSEHRGSHHSSLDKHRSSGTDKHASNSRDSGNKPKKKMAPPPMSFQQLLQIAQNKKNEDPEEPKKEQEEEEESNTAKGRPLTAEEKVRERRKKSKHYQEWLQKGGSLPDAWQKIRKRRPKYDSADDISVSEDSGDERPRKHGNNSRYDNRSSDRNNHRRRRSIEDRPSSSKSKSNKANEAPPPKKEPYISPTKARNMALMDKLSKHQEQIELLERQIQEEEEMATQRKIKELEMELASKRQARIQGEPSRKRRSSDEGEVVVKKGKTSVSARRSESPDDFHGNRSKHKHSSSSSHGKPSSSGHRSSSSSKQRSSGHSDSPRHSSSSKQRASGHSNSPRPSSSSKHRPVSSSHSSSKNQSSSRGSSNSRQKSNSPPISKHKSSSSAQSSSSKSRPDSRESSKKYDKTRDNVIMCKEDKKKEKEKHVSAWDRIYGEIQKNNPKPVKRKFDRYEEEDEYFDDDDYDEVDADEYAEMDDFIDDEPMEDTYGGSNNYSKYIRDIFGYDKRKFRGESDDTRNMEARFSDIMKEEARSARLGMKEDMEDIRREQEELKRKQMKANMKKKR